MVWAVGCSNGGMFTYELARDERTHGLLAGVAPMVGLPHNGFNFGPASPMSFIGMWGLEDHTVPPKASPADDGSFDPLRSSQQQGWFYSTADYVTQTWSEMLKCDEKVAVDLQDEMFDECWEYKDGTGGSEVLGCYFKYLDHGCDYSF